MQIMDIMQIMNTTYFLLLPTNPLVSTIFNMQRTQRQREETMLCVVLIMFHINLYVNRVFLVFSVTMSES